MKIRKQADQYPRDDKKVVYTPEEEAHIAELTERMRQKEEEDGTLEFNADGMTRTLQELHRMNKEKGRY